MKKFKALYKAMYDDLKDAEMMIDYACDIKKENPEDRALADELAKYAKYRLDHFTTFHKLFIDEAGKEKGITQRTVSDCMWGEAHEQMQDWHGKIEKKIAKYK